MVLDFMAHSVRHPGKKLRYAMLIKGAEEEGKSLLGMLVGRLVGPGNFGIVNSDQLTEKFNSWSHQRVFVIVEEIKLPGRDAPMVLNKLKPVVSNAEVPIRRMQKDVTTESNYCNIYLTTNFEDCLPMEEDNTRYMVLFTRFQTNAQVKAWRAARVKEEGFDYVRVLYDHMVEHPHQFQEFFHEREFSAHYDPDARAPWTRFKKQMADDAKTEERQLLEDMLDRGDHPAINDDVVIWSAFREVLDQKGLAPKLAGRGVTTFMKNLGFVRCTPHWRKTDEGRRKLRIWTRSIDQLDSEGRMSDELLAKAEVADQWVAEREDLDSLGDLT